MAKTPRFERLPPDHPYYIVVGRVAKEWAILEYTLDETIWELAGISAPVGACITAQLQGIQSRFRCLIALAAVHDAPDKTIKTLHSLSNKSLGLSTLRNRVVHDQVLRDQETGEAFQFIVTADKKLIADRKSASLTEANKVADDIAAHADKCFRIMHTVLRETASSRETPPPRQP